MKKIDRREFIKNTAKTTAAFAILNPKYSHIRNAFASDQVIEKVALGKSGLETSFLALGTGSGGWKRRSQQTRLANDEFLYFLQAAMERGANFLDTADIYGSHGFLKHALKTIPREKLTVMTKIWTRNLSWITYDGFQPTMDRFHKETGSEYFDIVLVHCQISPNWVEETKPLREAMSKAKQNGIIKTVGVSCHDFNALKAAAASDWVDVILARINHTGARMDAAPELVMPVLKEAHDKGKGIIGMKIFGCGQLTSDDARETSLNYVINSGNVDAMSIGFLTLDQLDDTIARINRIKGKV